jgi:hypothetical protein
VPDADCFGTLNVSAGGSGLALGSLPDGTRFRYKAPISKNGTWPFYAPLYLTKGALIGWLHFETNASLDDVSGSVAWFRPAQAGPYYPAGLTNFSTLSGSRYIAPANATDRVLDTTNGVLLLSGGNLSQVWTSDFVLEANNQVSNASTNTFTATISLSSGLFRGTFRDTGVNRTVSFSGALLQKSNRGAGFFLGIDQAGRVQIESRP